MMRKFGDESKPVIILPASPGNVTPCLAIVTAASCTLSLKLV